MIEGQETLTKVARLKYGMVGGGKGAFIGDVHRKAIAMDGKAELVAGCFSQSYQNTLETGEFWGLNKDRLYKNYIDMIKAEAKRPEKIDFIIIVTPNISHYPIAKLALENGIHVVCDKPLATSSRDAQELAKLAAKKDVLFCVTYAYSGFPIIKHMREMIAHGELGTIRFVAGEYPQDWLATLLEKTGQKQAAWRTDPKRAGISNCVGDIGSHIEHMVAYLTGLEIESLCARLDTFGEGRVLDDNASIMLNYKGGAKGLYWSSQIAVGHDNGFRVRIYGTKASLEWVEEDPNYCKVAFIDKPTVRLSRGRDKMYPRAQALSRIPSGHPEGYFECFANIYSTFLTALNKKMAGEPLTKDDLDFPTVQEGIRGVKFIEKCVESSKKGALWVNFD
ncbi:MAG: Gfo/Idh/MocA family oxidoreductase [Candidatus Aminicenantes bacterium]|nr:Gfo/Idh/MocA family oxidoreductase [Candidatus Aminicenantes bacterium]